MENTREFLRFKCLTEASILIESYQIDALLEEANEIANSNNPVKKKSLGDRISEAYARFKAWLFKTFKKDSVAKENCEAADANQLNQETVALKQQIMNANAGQNVEVQQVQIREVPIQQGSKFPFDTMHNVMKLLGEGISLLTVGWKFKNLVRNDAKHDKKVAQKAVNNYIKQQSGADEDKETLRQKLLNKANSIMGTAKGLCNKFTTKLSFGKNKNNQQENQNNQVNNGNQQQAQTEAIEYLMDNGYTLDEAIDIVYNLDE